MADERKYYVLCANNCKFEGMTKEQILTAIDQAVSTGEIKDVDTGFVTTIKEQNHLVGLSFWVGTQAEYNALTEKADNCFYIITDETSFADVVAVVEQLQKQCDDNSTDIASLKGSVSNANKGIEDINEALSITPTTATIFSGELEVSATQQLSVVPTSQYKLYKITFKDTSDGDNLYVGYANLKTGSNGNPIYFYGDLQIGIDAASWGESHLIYKISTFVADGYYIEFEHAYIKKIYIEQQNEGDITNVQANINEVGAYRFVLTEIVGII